MRRFSLACCLTLVTVTLLSGCRIVGPDAQGPDLTCIPSDANNQCTDRPWTETDGEFRVSLEGRDADFRVWARPSSYDPDEVVLLAYADGLTRSIQLTFDLAGRVNSEMTGFWDLGLCTPTNAYRFEGGQVSNLTFDPDSRRLSGRFSIRVLNESPPHDAISFQDGRFDVYLRVEPFEYCIEG